LCILSLSDIISTTDRPIIMKKGIMKKDSIICFRVSKDLHAALAHIAQKEKRSLSSIIEIVLSRYAKENKSFKSLSKERRQYPRKGIVAPVLIKQHDSGETKLDTGSITDISLGGVRLTIPRDAKCVISNDANSCRFEIIFTLPNENKLVYLTCEPRRVMNDEESMHVGASFVDANFQSYKTLQTYLM